MPTRTLRRGDSIEVNGRLTILKCGLTSQGGAPPVPTVTVQYGTEEVDDAAEVVEPAVPTNEDPQNDDSAPLDDGAIDGAIDAAADPLAIPEDDEASPL